jgi:hypothetical protein
MDPATKVNIAVNRALDRARDAIDKASRHVNAVHHNLHHGSPDDAPEIRARLECAMRELHATATALSVAQGIRAGADCHNPPYKKDK